MAKKRTGPGLFSTTPTTPPPAPTPPVVGTSALKADPAPEPALEPTPAAPVESAPDGPALALTAPNDAPRHPGQRTPFFIPAGATPAEVALWTDLKIVVSPTPFDPETPEERESTVWVIAVGLARDRDRNLFDTLRQLRAWGCRLAWTDRGGLRLNWRSALPNVPAGEWSMAHKMEVLSRNQAALVGVPEEFHNQLVTLLERYLEPCRESMAQLFREIAATWPEDARW